LYFLKLKMFIPSFFFYFFVKSLIESKLYVRFIDLRLNLKKKKMTNNETKHISFKII
jgi:hypothetical protein